MEGQARTQDGGSDTADRSQSQALSPSHSHSSNPGVSNPQNTTQAQAHTHAHTHTLTHAQPQTQTATYAQSTNSRGYVATTTTTTTTTTTVAAASHGQAAANLPPLEIPREPIERPSASNLRSAFGRGGTVRAVTPDLIEVTSPGGSAVEANVSFMPRSLGSQQSSPRSLPGAVNRRQGMVFYDNVGDPYESSESSPPPPPHRLGSANIRPRTRTMDTSMLAQRSAPPSTEQRHRVASVSSSGSQPAPEDPKLLIGSPILESLAYPSIASNRAAETSSPISASYKKAQSRRLMKRQSSRPTSPLRSPVPSVDSLPQPISTEDANKLILLMKTLCGRMRGEIQYKSDADGPWYSGLAYIDEDKASLMFDGGQDGPYHTPIVPDLRGCRVRLVDHPDMPKDFIEVSCAQPAAEVILRPVMEEEIDLWLAALLCWQQLRPNGHKLQETKAPSPAASTRPELRRQGKSSEAAKGAIIKVGNVKLWDKGIALSPRAIVKRSSTRDLRSASTAWRKVSCILHDNGDFKLLLENDVTVLSVIELSQLSRCAIQQLDRTVLDEEYCIAIFPTYASTSTRLSIFRPVYLALDNRVHFEVWFVLLRAFAVPDIYKLDDPSKEHIEEVADLERDYNGEVFRIEKTVLVRVTEAKLKPRGPPGPEMSPLDKNPKAEHDPLIGNYFAEVILDGEVRSRTTTKTGTKSPFWREDCEFIDLPPSVPYLSVVLKRVDGNMESLSHQLQASLGLAKTGNLQEVMCGAVDITLDQLEKGKDHEQWLQILDDKQQSIGSMLIKLSHDEHVVLLQKEYQPLSDVLHRFSKGLTAIIASLLPGQLRRLSELFLNIFQVSGSAGEWIMALVEDEIDGIGSQASIGKYRFSSRLRSNESMESASEREMIVRDMSKSLAGEANLLFRGNSLLTQSLEFHMRRLGKEYIEEVLRDKIFEINEINADCEVDPSKLPQATNAEMDQRWNQLVTLTTEIWQCIAESATRLPPELRHILKFIRAVAEDRYGDFLRSVAYTSVSGFLFLRFICPAILSPKLWGLLRDHPRPRAQRTLTLVAKALQKMANLSNFGKREEWMEPMNRFLNVQRQVFKDYIDKVCGIPAERSTNTVPASYSTPITILGRLGPTAKEGFPSLPYLIDQGRSYAGLVKLWVDSNPLESKRGTVDDEVLVFNELCMALQKRADACLAKVETFRGSDMSLYGMSDDLAETLEQASLIESLTMSFGGSSITWNDCDRPPGSSGSDVAEEPVNRGRSKELRHGREGWDTRKSSALRHVSGSSAGGTLKAKNGKVGRTILSGIMKISGRGESPDSRGQK
ncbi:Inhibitory regulator protein BUD2/CLA2 [Paramyrothecium foliicola]|nr:Inhibitory regulator protein BUD2/CLA2 [Paramyrothecium foliicola]